MAVRRAEVWTELDRGEVRALAMYDDEEIAYSENFELVSVVDLREQPVTLTDEERTEVEAAVETWLNDPYSQEVDHRDAPITLAYGGAL